MIKGLPLSKVSPIFAVGAGFSGVCLQRFGEANEDDPDCRDSGPSDTKGDAKDKHSHSQNAVDCR